MMSVFPANPLRIAVVTGSRAEFGLLQPIIERLAHDERFSVKVIVAGAHLVPGVETWREVEAGVGIAARVPMQGSITSSRADDAAALGRGVSGFAAVLPTLFDGASPDWVLLLGDRIEAFAAASAASLAGLAIAHLHGGDRAEGVADEAMRGAITKLANLHLPATQASAERIVKLGEPSDRVIVVGSPAMCSLEQIAAAPEADATLPTLIVLHHPAGLPDLIEYELARSVALGVARFATANAIDPARILWLAPNTDPGAQAVREAIGPIAQQHKWQSQPHLSRAAFLRCLASMAMQSGALVGNSSAGLIEAAGLRVGVVNCGPRQRGRERAGNVVDIRDHACDLQATEVAHAIAAASARSGRPCPHPYGDSNAHQRTADALAALSRLDPLMIRKRNTY